MNYTVREDLSLWVCYSRYEIKEDGSGRQYITPAPDATPIFYNLQRKQDTLVLDAVNVGMLCLGKKSDAVIREAVMEFVSRYGLLGLMTALPITPDFMEYERAFFPKNRFIREKSMETEAYQKLFYPFHDLQQVKKKLEPDWDDYEQLAVWNMLNLVSNQPPAVALSMLREYSEPYEWVVTQFKDWAYMLTTSYYFYADGYITDVETSVALQEGMGAFGGVFPSYYIMLQDKPTLVWNFHSLMQCAHLTLSFMLSDEKNPLRLCKYCHKAYVVTDGDSWFCSEKCKQLYEKNKRD